MTNWKYSLNLSCSKLSEKMISLHYIFILPLTFSGQVQTISRWHLFKCSPVNRNLCASCANITSNDSWIRFQLAHYLITQETEESPACSLKAEGLCSTSKNKNRPQLAELWHANQEHQFTFTHKCARKMIIKETKFWHSVQIAMIL